MAPKEMAQLYHLATGIEMTEAELMVIGERIHNVEKMFNVLHAGFTRKDDYPPERLMTEPIKSGPCKGELLNKADWDRTLDEYYEVHGWDRFTSWPAQAKLNELGLSECTEMLKEARRLHLTA